MYYANINQNTVQVDINYKIRIITKDIGGYYIVIKRSILHEAITIPNIYAIQSNETKTRNRKKK